MHVGALSAFKLGGRRKWATPCVHRRTRCRTLLINSIPCLTATIRRRRARSIVQPWVHHSDVQGDLSCSKTRSYAISGRGNLDRTPINKKHCVKIGMKLLNCRKDKQ